MRLINYTPSLFDPHWIDGPMFQNGHHNKHYEDSAAIQWNPECDIQEHEDHFKITADLPGVAPQDIKVSLEQGVLAIVAERKLNQESKDSDVIYSQRASGKFYRRFRLPDMVDEDGIEATVKHGVLVLTVPKQTPSLREIVVKS